MTKSTLPSSTRLLTTTVVVPPRSSPAISAPVRPVTYERYPGARGSTQGLAKDTIPAAKARSMARTRLPLATVSAMPTSAAYDFATSSISAVSVASVTRPMMRPATRPSRSTTRVEGIACGGRVSLKSSCSRPSASMTLG